MKNLQWQKTQNAYLLKNEEEVLLDLTLNPAKTSYFTLDNKKFSIKITGFWQPIYSVFEGDNEIAKLTHNFWGSDGKISFNDDTFFTSQYKYKGGFKLIFADGENEVLRDGTEVIEKKHEVTFSVGFAMVDAEKLLILAALGKVIFTTLYMEASGDDVMASLLLLS